MVLYTENTTNSNNGGGAIFNYGVGTLDSPDIVFNGEILGTQNSNIVIAGLGSVKLNNGINASNAGDVTLTLKNGEFTPTSAIESYANVNFVADADTTSTPVLNLLNGSATNLKVNSLDVKNNLSLSFVIVMCVFSIPS